MHTIGLWVYYNAQTIQSVTAALALIGLVVYALDTRQIRRATLSQSDASRRPYFHAEDWTDTLNADVFQNKDYYQFRNVGSGIALKVCWRYVNDTSAPLVSLGSCAVGRVKYLFTKNDEWIEYRQIEANKGVYLEYEDTAGKRYWTTLSIRLMADGSSHALVDTGDILRVCLSS